jgi:hypothetical protein
MELPKITVVNIYDLKLSPETLDYIFNYYNIIFDVYYRYYILPDDNQMSNKEAYIEINAGLRRIGYDFSNPSKGEYISIYLSSYRK